MLYVANATLHVESLRPTGGGGGGGEGGVCGLEGAYIGVKGQLLAAYSWCLRLETCHAPPRLAPDEMLPALSPIFAFLFFFFLVFFIKSNEPNKKTLI